MAAPAASMPPPLTPDWINTAVLLSRVKSRFKPRPVAAKGSLVPIQAFPPRFCSMFARFAYKRNAWERGQRRGVTCICFLAFSRYCCENMKTSLLLLLAFIGGCLQGDVNDTCMCKGQCVCKTSNGIIDLRNYFTYPWVFTLSTLLVVASLLHLKIIRPGSK